MPARKRKRIFTTGQVARICDVAPRTVSKWFDSGRIRGYRIPGSKDRRIPVDQLVRFMKAHDIPLDGLDLGPTRVLLVDDDVELAGVLAQALGSDGECEVTSAASVFEAGVLVEGVRPHVIIIDVSLPDIDAKRICQTLLAFEQLSDIKLIAMGGALTEGQGQGLLQDGCIGYLRKPFDIRDLRTLIDEAVGREE